MQLVEKDMRRTYGGNVCEIPGSSEKMKRNLCYNITKEFYVGLYGFQASPIKLHLFSLLFSNNNNIPLLDTLFEYVNVYK